MRDRIVILTVTALFILLFAGLFYNQVVRFGYYSRMSKNNSIRVIPIDGPRGNIYDRNGVKLVSNRLSFDAAVVYQELKNKQKFVHILSESLNMSGRDIMRALEKARARPYAPVTVLEDIDKTKAIMLEEASFDVEGLAIETRSKRNYIYGNTGSHIFGYMSEITDKELDDLRDYGYRMGDLVGRAGLEKQYETYLRGVDGGTQIEVDSRGRETRVIGVKEPMNGRDLYLTIDIALQSACDKLLGERKGAICVMNPNTGEVLALASHPSFDPNVFVVPKSSEDRTALIKDRVGRPLSNRAISGLYPPGSVFKVVTASAALEEKKITPNTRFFCSGTYRLGKAEFDCWKSEGHGSQNMTEGFMNSCDVYFYSIGRAAGVDAVERYAKLYGFGRATSIDIPDEVNGLAPGREWKKHARHSSWFEGDTVNYSIGQGYLLVTPIQVAVMMSVIANDGNLVKPYLVRRIGDVSIHVNRPKHIGLDQRTVSVIGEGMYEVVNNVNGTGKKAKPEGVVVSGKTGTAENPHGRTHAWFSGFAPYRNPKICLVVFLEHGGKGGVAPSEIARGIFEEARKKGYL
ncbi:MAG: penicillin-binding protein 2 [Candidatus Omnitrophica bacterium]|nr:penicillin-binding protein 2 [Candidatus Omnitrophota bacterium]